MPYDTIADNNTVVKTIAALKAKGIEAEVVQTRAEALAKIKELIPEGVSIMNGASVTLEEIGFVEYLKGGQHGWNNLHEAILAEKDPAKQSTLRKQSVLSEYYLGSVHALAESGELVIASNTGSQLPHIVCTSPNIIFVVGMQKIVPTLDEAIKRLREYVVPLEDKHMLGLYNVNTALNKIVIWNGESTMTNRNVRMILVNEKLGF
jgi:L-lactate utilization protein LutC